MKSFMHECLLMIILMLSVAEVTVRAQLMTPSTVTCRDYPGSRCYMKRKMCPPQCPYTPQRAAPDAFAACYMDCDSPMCSPACFYRRPNCHGIGAACYDPRLIGADGVAFYFHGESNHHFALVSDTNLQINARFIGHRPASRRHDYTWIQALGVLFGSHNFSVEATRAAKWDENIDHLKFTFDNNEISVSSRWESKVGGVMIDRLSRTNSASISIDGVVEIGVNVVPITKHDDRVHNYQIPFERDCFAYLEVQFKFSGLSATVEGVLGRTYRPDYENRVELGVAMPVVGGEKEYRTTSLFAADCLKCVFSRASDEDKYNKPVFQAISHY